MTAGELAILSLGFLLGAVAGAFLVLVVRNRTRPAREIRLTVTPDSVPRRRSSTLADQPFGPSAESTRLGQGGPPGATTVPRDRRTDVRVAGPAISARGQASAGEGAGAAALRDVDDRPSEGVAIPIHRETDWTLEALRAAAAATAEQAMRDQQASSAAVAGGSSPPGSARAAGGAGRLPPRTTPPIEAAGPAPPGRAAAGPAPPGRAAATPASPGLPAALGPPAAPGRSFDHETGDPAEAGATGTDTEGCAALRQVADERCARATRARTQARSSQEALRDARRAYDGHVARADEAALLADPRAVRVAKEAAHEAFRAARDAARDRQAVEAAARAWLSEINRINLAAREAGATVERERRAATTMVASVERLTVEADAARVAAEAADEACMAARQALAACQEAASSRPAARGEEGQAWPGGASVPDDEPALEAALRGDAPGEPAILRLLRGDRAALTRLVATLGGDDPGERRRWQLALAELVDAIVSGALESSSLRFPEDHPFWGTFSAAQCRDIAAALASLGYRFDGLGGWADERVPRQRDLSLAVGHAGLDPMRIRRWPSDRELADLLREVTVAADEYLVAVAGGLSLGEMVVLLGRQADALAELWNEWGRVRPLLLSST